MGTSKLNCFKKRYPGDSCEWKNNGPREEYVTFILLFPLELEDGFPSELMARAKKSMVVNYRSILSSSVKSTFLMLLFLMQ